MPVQECQLKGKPGWRWGRRGKCYTYTEGDEEASTRAHDKAEAQGAAIRARQAEGKTAAKAGDGDAELTQEELDARDAKLRQKSLKATTEAVTAVMDNSDGLARLRAISDEEWAEAEARSNGTD